MSTIQPDSSTTFCWEIKRFQFEWLSASEEGEDMSSDTFSLVSHPSIQFCLRFDGNEKEEWSKSWYGLVVKDFGGNQSIEASYKIWFENKDKEKIFEPTEGEGIFNHKNVAFGWTEMDDNERNLFSPVYESEQTIYMCCEVEVLSVFTEVDQTFCLNQWNLYEEGIYDAKIYVGENKKEFKVLKSFFMAQSPVFKAMFQSENFKEAKTNEVTIEEISEEIMLALIEWIYMSQLNDECPIEGLFKASDKYQIEMLKSKCVTKMIATLNITNVFHRLAIALLYKQGQLEEDIVKFLNNLSEREMIECMMSDEWRKISHEEPQIATDISKVVLEKVKK